MPGADCGSDHIPVIGCLKIKLKKLKKAKRLLKLNLNLLRTDEDLRNRLAVSIQNKFEILYSLTKAEERSQKNERMHP